MSRLNLPGPTGVVFGSGLARSAGQVGMWRVFESVGVKAGLAVGSSTGAVNAALLACYPAEFEPRARALWSAVAADRSLTSGWRTTARGLARRQSNRTRTMLTTHLQAAFGDLTFAETEIPLTVMATDVDSGQPVEIRGGLIVDALIASMSVPILLPPAEVAGRSVVDASVSAGLPVLPALTLARSLLVLDAGSSRMPSSALTDLGWYEVMGISALHMLRVQAVHDIAVAAAEVPVIISQYAAGSPFDLRSAPAAIDAGAEQGQRVIEELLQGRASRRITRPKLYGALAS